MVLSTQLHQKFNTVGESGACFGTGSEAVPWGHVNGPSERRIRPAFLQPRALDGTALKEMTHLRHFFENIVSDFHNTVFHSLFRNTTYIIKLIHGFRKIT